MEPPPAPISTPPPPASVVSVAKTSTTKNKNPFKAPNHGITRCILFLAKYSFSFDSWIKKSKTTASILLTSTNIEREMSFGEKSYFNLIESFDNYDTNGLVELRAVELQQEGWEISHVVFLSEEDVLRGNRIRYALKLPDWDESCLRFRDKVLMKNRLIEKGLRVPKFRTIENGSDVISFVNEFGFPFVLKPRKGFGSISTFVVRDEKDLRLVLPKMSSGSVLDAPIELEAEVFVTGQFFHIDGLVQNRKLIALWPSAYINQVVNFHANNFIAGHSLSADNPLTARLQHFISQCLDALQGPPTYPFHAEAWVTPEDEIVFCEVASRTGGGGIPQQFERLFGLNLNQVYAQAQANEPISSKFLTEPTFKDLSFKDRKPLTCKILAWLFVYPQEFSTLQQIPKDCDLVFVESYSYLVENGHEYQERASCADACCSMIVSGLTEEEAKENVKKAQTWFNSTCVWVKNK